MQTILVIAAITGAVAYLSYLVYKKYFTKNECEGCAMNKASESTQI